MKYIVNNIRIPLSEIKQNNEVELINYKVSKKVNVPINKINNFGIVKESVDARKKNNIFMVYSVMIEIPRMNYSNKDVIKLIQTDNLKLQCGNYPMPYRPVIIGAGPAGLFTAWLLVEHGFCPIIIERGSNIEKRTKEVKEFWVKGILNPETNVQFGEGGAGTFSDGKLTTRINDPRCDKVLKVFCENGAPEEILYKAKPHIGTDRLKDVIINMRKSIEEKGGTFLFDTKVEDINIYDGRVKSVKTSQGETIDTETVILAIGHSARDTFNMIYDKNVTIEPKAFSVGVRIEHLQNDINYIQYGKYVDHFKLAAADYQLSSRINERATYTFCMCPGGTVVAASSEPNTIVTNGMSEFARDKSNSNSAFVVSVTPKDFGSTHPLSGIEYQRQLEKRAYDIGGGNYRAPVQKLGDFLDGVPSIKAGTINPSYTGEFHYTDIHKCLPYYVSDCLKKAVVHMDKKLKGFANPDAILTAVETRTSSPVRIPRNEQLESVSIEGLYPAGEGAGYAGGIMSAAVDGLRVAERIIGKFKPTL